MLTIRERNLLMWAAVVIDKQTYASQARKYQLSQQHVRRAILKITRIVKGKLNGHS